MHSGPEIQQPGNTVGLSLLSIWGKRGNLKGNNGNSLAANASVAGIFY